MGATLRLAFVALEPATRPIADETMWLMALNRIPAAHFSPWANYPIFHPPLYPYFLAAAHSLFGTLTAVKVLQALLGSLLIPAVFRVGLQVVGPRTAVFGALVTAVYPELIWYSTHFWCETLFLALLWWAIERVLVADRTASTAAVVSAGVLFGLAILTRETLLYLLPVAALWLGHRGPRRPWRLAGTLVGVTLAVVLPWTLRNWVQFDAFIPVSTGGGLNLYQGNAEISRSDVYEEYYANEGKVEQFQWARAEGLKAIWRRQPGWIFEKIRDEGPRLAEVDSLALIHMRRGAYGALSCGAYRTVAAAILLPWLLVGVAAVLGLARAPMTRGHTLLLALAASYLLLHIATHGFSRYRLPMLPVLFILAASTLETDGPIGRTFARNLKLVVFSLALAGLWAPSLLEQAGHLGMAAPPSHEGFPALCPVPEK